MILRRVINHFRKQEWTAIAIDFLIVVLGVFIGIQVANWNAARADAHAYQEALARLRVEIAANLKMLDEADADVAAEAPAVRRAYDALATCIDTPETQMVVNDGLKFITGTNGLQIRRSELELLTSDPRLLAQQSPAIRNSLSDLKFAAELVERMARNAEGIPNENRAERIAGVRPGPRIEYETTYLGDKYAVHRRILELSEPVSVACKSQDLIAALWLWERFQSNLPIFGQKLRSDYLATLEVLDTEAQR